MTTENAVIYEVRNAVAWLTLNRPAVHNSINVVMRDQLKQHLAAAEADADVRVVVLTGAGQRAFSAGADIKAFGDASSPVDYRRERYDGHWIKAFHRVHKPIVAAINGYCLGGGLEMALACDIRIASDTAVFALPEVSVGTIPGAGGTQLLSRVIGMGPALDLILSAERISAERALALGLITRMCAADSLLQMAEALATRISGLAPLALRSAKEAVIRGADLPLEAGLHLELDLLTQLLPSEDRAEAAQAFRDKRAPNFRGR